MKLLCLDIPLPGASPESYHPHLQDEARHGWQLYKRGIVRDIYFRRDRPGVAIIAECDSVEAARQALRKFPLAKVGLIDWEIIPLGPCLSWEMLFAPGNA
ncbi:superoxide dismutase [Trinickia violacea]|uniref:Superoxide dismutase n=1 Tax=Trinickia violacea TaxID=2571746 RepID=A0A4V1EHX1_9BURK|nr:superoxide dismutase [Trinickia violacea]QCP51750.1 superoxide dismutase [Trinickia violacea]